MGVYTYGINWPQIKCVLRVSHMCLRVRVYMFLRVTYVNICVAACYTAQSHVSASVTQVFNNAHQSITCCSLC